MGACFLETVYIAQEVYFAGNLTLNFNSHFRPNEAEAPVWRSRADQAPKVPEVDILA